MNRQIQAGAALLGAVALSFATVALGETGDAAGGGPYLAQERSALLDARLLGFKASLKLTPDQEKNWTGFETALRDVAKNRRDRRAKMRAERNDGDARPTPMDRMLRMSERMTQRAAELKQVADASSPLYASLDDSQKRLFAVLFRDFTRANGHAGAWRGHDHEAR